MRKKKVVRVIWMGKIPETLAKIKVKTLKSFMQNKTILMTKRQHLHLIYGCLQSEKVKHAFYFDRGTLLSSQV